MNFAYFGTIRLNKREIPNIDKLMVQVERFNFFFNHTIEGKVSLTVYKIKKTKNVAILSLFHARPLIRVRASEKRKANTVEDYNL
jgi:hypothetical protein